VFPNPIVLDVDIPCAGIMGSCTVPDYLVASWTVSVSTLNSIGGRGIIDVVLVDARTGMPVSNQQGTVSGDVAVVLTGNDSVTVAQKLTWQIQGEFTHPGMFSLVFTVHFTDTSGVPVSETLTVPGVFPPGEAVGAAVE
jgi:hypothetical protein